MSMDLNRLKVLATLATPGKWKWDFGNHQVEHEETRTAICDIPAKDPDGFDKNLPKPRDPVMDGCYIAAMSPDTTLALVARIEELEKIVANYERITGISSTARGSLTDDAALKDGDEK